jgi:hypothetical protein
MLKLLITFIIITALSACSSIQPIEGPITKPNVLKQVKAGDWIQVETLTGATHEMRVISITSTAIQGEQLEIPLAQIKTINAEQFSLLKTTGTIVGSMILIITAIVLSTPFY